MSNPTALLTACPLRPIMQASDQYAANIISGLEEELATEYAAQDFLATTHLTKATADFLGMAMNRVALGRDSTSPSVYQLYSRYGGGKTHSLLLLAAAAKYPYLQYWNKTAGCDAAAARFIAFDGEKHNVINGATLDDQGNRAQSLAGYMLYQLGGPAALQEFGAGDARMLDPGSEAFERLIGNDPVIIVIDELVQYINRVEQLAAGDASIKLDGVLTTLTALSSAVINSPRAALVITVPEDSHELLDEKAAEPAGDAYRADALELTDMLNRINSQLGRVMHPVAPSEEADLPAILRKRLFYGVDNTARHNAASVYSAVIDRNGRAGSNLDYQGFYDAYPFHPSLLSIITGRLSANRNFQRVRGTLRLLGNTLLAMKKSDSAAALVHPYHVNLRCASIRTEVVNRPGFSELDPAIDIDIVGINSTADRIDSELAEAAAVTMLLGTIAPENSNGLYHEQIVDALLSPEHDDYGAVASAMDRFLSRAIYVDDSPDTQRKRFSKDPNVMKELLEARDAITTNTTLMSELFRQAINSAYGGGNSRRDSEHLEILIFPSRRANVPDNPDRAVLGIVNPDHWNWHDAGNAANGMSRRDLLDLHRHNSGNDGEATRQYPNNALLLTAHDANLSRIYEDIATMEAAERLLKDPSRPLPKHRRDTLDTIHASSEKNAITGIQNKFTHLFSAGNSPQHQWPEDHSHLEHRRLEAITDVSGKGQENIIKTLGDQALHGGSAGLSRSVWERVSMLSGAQGVSIKELREYFARTPDARIVINEATWKAMIANGVNNDALVVMTPAGEINPPSYNQNWSVWIKGREPAPKPEPVPAAVATPSVLTQSLRAPGGLTARPEPPAGAGAAVAARPAAARHTSFASGKMPGKAAYEAVKRFMTDNNHDWSALKSCEVKGTTPALADQIASIPQGDDSGIAITMKAQNQELQVAINNVSPDNFKEYAGPARRMLNKAEVSIVDVVARLEPAVARNVLANLNNRDEANIHVAFD